VADFSPACQAARLVYQRAMTAYFAARADHLRAIADHRTAVDELGRARQQLDRAQAALIRANDAWDGQTRTVETAPALGVPNVEAGVVRSPEPPPADVAIAALFHARIEPNFSIYAAGDAPALNIWQRAADAALQSNANLRAAALGSVADLAREAAQHAAAVTAETAARQSEQNAAAIRSEASARGSAALAEVLKVCAGQVANHPLGGGGEIHVGPAVLPDDEARLREKLDSLPDAETEGLDMVEVREESSEMAGDGHCAGNYRPSSRAIRLFMLGHDERVLKHEVGHHVYFNRLSATAVARWKQFYADGSHHHPQPVGQMPTAYAATGDGEGFADVYEYYRDGKRLHPEVQRLMEELLGELS
jgi:hypothetical protein